MPGRIKMAIKMGRTVFGASVMALATAIGAQAAMAQATSDTVATPAASAATEEIVVTGSRLANAGFSAPTPVTVVGAAEIARQGATNVAEVLNQVPAFRAQNTPQTSANFASNLGASTADLRGLGANRTLVLIGGRRVVAATTQGSSTVPANAVDLNMIPTSLIARSEVVTGGASAQYGSDAVAGVVNIILDTKFNGFRGSVQYGQTDHNDAKDYAASFGFGTRLGERGHLIVGVDYDDNKGAGDCYTRKWCAQAYAPVSVPFALRAANGGAAAILPNATTATASYNGLVNAANTAGLTTAQAAAATAAVNAAALVGTEFSQNGQTVFRHNYGTYFGIGLFQSGGGDGVNPYFQNFALSTPVRKVSSYAQASYELTDSITLSGELSYSDVRGHNFTSQNRDTNIVIQRDNAFAPAALVAALTALPNFAPNVPASVLIGRIGQDFGPALAKVQRNTFRGVLGLDGKLGNGWSWNTYYQYGRTNYHQQQSNNKINDNYLKAIDSVRNAAGNIVCRVNADAITTNDDPACAPLNIFGQNNWSPASKAYAFGTAIQDTKITQHVVAATLSGNLVDLWAGPLSFATGAEYRKDGAHGTADPISTALRFYTAPGAAINGDLNVKEGFIEAGLPLAKDAPFARSLDLNGAVRVTDYSTSGTVWSWKAGATYEPVSSLRFRVTRSRDIRAPNIFELNGPQQSSFSSVVDPLNNGAQGLPQVINGGNKNLNPEVAKTWTIGTVLQPDFWGLNRLRFSVDYYDIKLTNAISTLGAQLIVNLCAQGNTALCSQVVRAGGTANGTIQQVFNTNLNLNKVHANGLDFELSYSTPLDEIGLPGAISARVLATRAIHLTTTDATGAKIDRANQIGAPTSQLSGVPRWQGNYYLTYTNGPFSGTMHIRYVSKGVKDATLLDPTQPGYAAAVANPANASTTSINHAPAYTYMNINASYAIVDDGKRKVELFGVVNNLFATTPPNYLNASFGPTNNVLYDVLGRAYRVGVRVAF
jgi:outer membrane receptor protein involved in Fe transport